MKTTLYTKPPNDQSFISPQISPINPLRQIATPRKTSFKKNSFQHSIPIMNFLQTLHFILQIHEAGFDHDGIGSLLQASNIFLPPHFIRDIIHTLHDLHPPSVEDGPLYGVDWCMRGFSIILLDAAAGEMSEQICVRLGNRGYYWSHALVCEVMLAQFLGAEWGNGNLW